MRYTDYRIFTQRCMFHSETNATASNPWFAVTVGLLGLILGYAIGASGTFTLTPVPAGQPTGAAQQQASAAPQPAAKVPPVTRTDHVRGNPRARISIIEYSDFQCPFCKRNHPTMKQILATYGDDVNWVYRHFPLTSIHPNAQKAAEASECAADQGGNDAFWAYTDALFALDQLSPDAYPKIAKDLKLNVKTFNDCLASGKFAKAIGDQASDGAAAGVQGTPSNFIVVNKTGESQTVDGAQPFDNFKSIIDQKLR